MAGVVCLLLLGAAAAPPLYILRLNGRGNATILTNAANFGSLSIGGDANAGSGSILVTNGGTISLSGGSILQMTTSADRIKVGTGGGIISATPGELWTFNNPAVGTDNVARLKEVTNIVNSLGVTGSNNLTSLSFDYHNFSPNAGSLLFFDDFRRTNINKSTNIGSSVSGHTYILSPASNSTNAPGFFTTNMFLTNGSLKIDYNAHNADPTNLNLVPWQGYLMFGMTNGPVNTWGCNLHWEPTTNFDPSTAFRPAVVLFAQQEALTNAGAQYIGSNFVHVPLYVDRAGGAQTVTIHIEVGTPGVVGVGGIRTLVNDSWGQFDSDRLNRFGVGQSFPFNITFPGNNQCLVRVGNHTYSVTDASFGAIAQATNGFLEFAPEGAGLTNTISGNLCLDQLYAGYSPLAGLVSTNLNLSGALTANSMTSTGGFTSVTATAVPGYLLLNETNNTHYSQLQAANIIQSNNVIQFPSNALPGFVMLEPNGTGTNQLLPTLLSAGSGMSFSSNTVAGGQRTITIATTASGTNTLFQTGAVNVASSGTLNWGNGITGNVVSGVVNLGVNLSQASGTNALIQTNGVNVGTAGTVNFVAGANTTVTGMVSGAVATIGVSSTGGSGSSNYVVASFGDIDLTNSITARSGQFIGNAGGLTNSSHLMAWSSTAATTISAGANSQPPLGGQALNNTGPTAASAQAVLGKAGIISNLLLTVTGSVMLGSGTNLFFGIYTNGVCSSMTNTLIGDATFTVVSTNTGTATINFAGGTNRISMLISNQSGGNIAGKQLSAVWEFFY